MSRLVNLGSLCIDHVYRVPQFVRPGETLSSLSHQTFPGGKGLNQSLAARRAGAPVSHVGCVGEDGAPLIAVLEQSGVDVADIRIVADAFSGHAVIQVNELGENAIVIAGGANRMLESHDIDRAIGQLRPDDWLLLQNEVNDLPEILRRASAHLAKVAFNVAPVDGRERDYDLSAVDLLIVNNIEAMALLGKPFTTDPIDPIEGIVQLKQRWPDADIVLTLGARGLLYAGESGVVQIPAYPVRVVDETAAGDAFIGFLLAGLISGKPAVEALREGCAAGALTVSRIGAASAIPTRVAVEAKMAQSSGANPVIV